MFKGLFELRGEVSTEQSTLISVFGLCLIIFLWQMIVTFGNISPTLFPSASSVVFSFKELFVNDNLISNALFSIKLNILGYIEAVICSVVLGFTIGLFPIFREAVRKPLDTLRYLPIPAMTGLFINWCGIDNNMKIQFLAFSITAYLLPVVIQRIQEVPEVYIQTIKTLSNKNWELIKLVFIPSALETVYEDIRVLVAISWTYIMVAELVNKTGGLGSMIYLAARQGRVDKVFAILVVITIIGLVQDKLFSFFGKIFFAYKYDNGAK